MPDKKPDKAKRYSPTEAYQMLVSDACAIVNDCSSGKHKFLTIGAGLSHCSMCGMLILNGKPVLSALLVQMVNLNILIKKIAMVAATQMKSNPNVPTNNQQKKQRKDRRGK